MEPQFPHEDEEYEEQEHYYLFRYDPKLTTEKAALCKFPRGIETWLPFSRIFIKIGTMHGDTMLVPEWLIIKKSHEEKISLMNFTIESRQYNGDQ